MKFISYLKHLSSRRGFRITKNSIPENKDSLFDIKISKFETKIFHYKVLFRSDKQVRSYGLDLDPRCKQTGSFLYTKLCLRGYKSLAVYHLLIHVYQTYVACSKGSLFSVIGLSTILLSCNVHQHYEQPLQVSISLTFDPLPWGPLVILIISAKFDGVSSNSSTCL